MRTFLIFLFFVLSVPVHAEGDKTCPITYIEHESETVVRKAYLAMMAQAGQKVPFAHRVKKQQGFAAYKYLTDGTKVCEVHFADQGTEKATQAIIDHEVRHIREGQFHERINGEH